MVLMELKEGAWHGANGVAPYNSLHGGADVSLEDLQQRGIFGIESETMLGTCKRTDLGGAVYAGSGHGVTRTMPELKVLALRRIEEERLAYAHKYGISEADVYAKVGVASEMQKKKQMECYRYRDQHEYPNGGIIRGQITPNIFSRKDGRILLHGIEHNGTAAVLEAAGACTLNEKQALTHDLNQDSTADKCLVTHVTYGIHNPCSLYIMLCRPHVSPGAIVSRMLAHKRLVAETKRAIALREAAAALREQQGGDEELDAETEIVKRRREAQKVQNAANGAGKRTKPNKPHKPRAHPRFKSVLQSESFPKGPAENITADHPAVKFHVKAIYDHLLYLYGGALAAEKMNLLTAPETKPRSAIALLTAWDPSFPAYGSAPKPTLKAGLVAFWNEKQTAL